MLLSQALNAFGLVLDIAGFTILFALARPAVMRRNFVTSDRVGLDGVEPDFSAFEQLGNRLEARRREEKRGKRQTLWYCRSHGPSRIHAATHRVVRSIVRIALRVEGFGRSPCFRSRRSRQETKTVAWDDQSGVLDPLPGDPQ